MCRGTGWKPCGQCEGTGINPSDAFGGKFKAGDACWLCEGKNGARTMCGNCVDLTDTFCARASSHPPTFCLLFVLI